MPPRLSALDTLQRSGDEADGAESLQAPGRPIALSRVSRVQRWTNVVGHHMKNHVGVGIICSVAYFDPLVYMVCL